ncbi:hypothetical protein EK21DRAFT_107754 [Setomelanomma holmii]|uniref:Uncharacterized protein n=1 Tax=Setomelanomma holmii TaxID=210430 RepID=A0A9P4HHZ9_9PLEO|nr:hypothetical protein EK21DRAFT_107754 [Setomelanomma holmii]
MANIDYTTESGEANLDRRLQALKVNPSPAGYEALVRQLHLQRVEREAELATAAAGSSRARADITRVTETCQEVMANKREISSILTEAQNTVKERDDELEAMHEYVAGFWEQKETLKRELSAS